MIRDDEFCNKNLQKNAKVVGCDTHTGYHGQGTASMRASLSKIGADPSTSRSNASIALIPSFSRKREKGPANEGIC